MALKEASLSVEDRRRYLAIALAQSAKVGALARSLFELARLEHGGVKLEWETFALPELVQDVLQKFELAAQSRGQQLQQASPAGLPLVCADVALIERVLTNLIDNALRHVPERGSVRVELAPVAEGVRVRVADSGPGVPDELRATLFHAPSALGSNRGHQGGLGLLIVRRIVELHGGSIRLLADTGGAVFEFVVPRVDSAQQRPGPPLQ